MIITYPRIIAKDSSLEKYEAPGNTVTVSLPEKEIGHKTREFSGVVLEIYSANFMYYDS